MWTQSQIRLKLIENDQWLIRGILAIYNFQTAEEQAAETTLKHNGVGFNGVDAPILSSFAKQYKTKGYLSPKQLAKAREKMMKYVGQLTTIANNNTKEN